MAETHLASSTPNAVPPIPIPLNVKKREVCGFTGSGMAETRPASSTVPPVPIPFNVEKREVCGFTGSGMVRTTLALALYH